MAPAVERVDRRVPARVGPRAAEAVEAADDLQRRLRDGLVEVAARRRYGSADGDRTRRAVFQLDASRALVERGYAAFEIGGKRLLARNLLETARKFAHGLRPARSGVCKHEHVEPHLAEVLRKRNRRIHRRLARRDRHGRRVADDDRALHERLARLRVHDLGELLQGLDDLARAFAACGRYHDIDLRVARRSLLQNGFACTERTGDAVRAADRHREKRVDRADRGLKRIGRLKPFGEALDRNLHRPALHHLHLYVLAGRIRKRRDILRDGIVAGGRERLDRVNPAERERNHYLVAGHRLLVEDALRDPSEEVARSNAVADLGRGVPVPLPVARQAGKIHAALKEELGVLRNLRRLLREVGKRVLQPVVDLRKHPGPKLRSEQLAGELHLVADHEVGGVVENLHVAARAAHADDFGHEPLVSQHGVADLVLGYGALEGDGYHVPVYGCDLSCCCHENSPRM